MDAMHIYDKPDLFSIPLDQEFPDLPQHFSLLYSPLTDSALVADRQWITEFVRALEGKAVPAENMTGFIDSLKSFDRYPQYEADFTGVSSLAILPTAACNFRCSYCYSRFSRNQDALDLDQIIAVCGEFIRRNRHDSASMIISFMGGGEPMLFPRLLQAVSWCREYAEQQRLQLKLQLVTNGSLLTGENIRSLISSGVTVIFSFEILEDIQNRQRSSYSTVRENIRQFTAAGGNAVIRSTVTGLNVHLQNRMIDEVRENYPAVKQVIFEPVLDTEKFHTPELFAGFFNTFTDNYFQALDSAGKYGIKLTTSLHNRVDAASCRYCLPEWCVTPSGKFTVCHRLSSPEDTGFAENCFGEVTSDGSIIFDNARWERIVSENTNRAPHCTHCFARWNCAGGCRIQNLLFPEKMLPVRCQLTREFIKKMLLRRIEKMVREEMGKSSLRELLAEGVK